MRVEIGPQVVKVWHSIVLLKCTKLRLTLLQNKSSFHVNLRKVKRFISSSQQSHSGIRIFIGLFANFDLIKQYVRGLFRKNPISSFLLASVIFRDPSGGIFQSNHDLIKQRVPSMFPLPEGLLKLSFRNGF